MAERLADVLKTYEMIDLSVTLGENLPCWWPGNHPFRAEKVAWYDNAGYFNRLLRLEEHTGTHFDAPPHFVQPSGSGAAEVNEYGNITAEQVPVYRFAGPAAVIDMRQLRDKGEPGESPLIKPAHIENWEMANGKLQMGQIVLFATGWSDRYYQPFPEGMRFAAIPFDERTAGAWPAPDESTIEMLYARGIRTIGVDTPSVGAAQKMKETHLSGLGRGMTYIESLTSLDKLPATGALFVFLPLKIEQGSGAPGRAVAWVPR